MAKHLFRSGIVAPAEGKKRRIIEKNRDERVIASDQLAEQQERQNLAWQERMAEQRKQWRAQDERKFYNPDRDPNADSVWCVYAWFTHNPKLQAERWHKVGERKRKRGRRKPMTLNRLFANIRQALNVRKDIPVKLISKQDDLARKRRGELWEHVPPKHVDTLAPWDPPTASLVLRETPPTTKTKVRKDQSPKLDLVKKEDSAGRVTFGFRTRYVAFGQRQGGPWIYLGPAQADKKVSAKAEIRHRFPLYPEPLVLAVKDLPYSFRARLKDGRVRPGATKIEPPKEVK